MTLSNAAYPPAELDPGKLRLVTFLPSDMKTPRIGIVKDDGRIADLTTAAGSEQLCFDPANMLSLISAGSDGLNQARDAVSRCAQGEMFKEVRILAPIPHPIRNVFAVGWNYLGHFIEGQVSHGKTIDFPLHPTFFTKASGTINGPYDPIPYDATVSVKIDWECELAVVIGKVGVNISESDAMDHVFGYAVINDTSAREFSKKHGGQWFKGKSLDGHGPFGPWIVPAADIDPSDLRLYTRVNGVVKQDASTSQMYFKIARIISELSLGMTLKPGDIIATGTPEGVGNSRNPPEYLMPGDVMETEIVGIGTLRNIIRAASQN